jgi:hypothetical protein
MLIVICPHCGGLIEIEQINCAIFRHGYFKNCDRQVNPHLDKEGCDELIRLDLIWGCGKPFKIVNNMAMKCDYI